MSHKKKEVRQQFRDVVFKRAKYCCEKCGKKGVDRQAGGDDPALDAHHITDRHLFNNGGYILENGISLCDECHHKAEMYHSTGISVPGYSPEDLYKIIKSSYDEAYAVDGD